MTLKAVLKWKNQDSTIDLNSRFKALFAPGIIDGGLLTPVSGQLKVDIQPFEAFSFDGMMVTNDAAERVTLPLNQTTIISIKAQYQLGADPVLAYAVNEASVFASLVDKDYHIVFGQVTLGNSATQVLAADIAYYTRMEQTKRGRDSFRGRLASVAYLPVDNRNHPGDYYIINAGVGDAPEIFSWNGLAWVNITQTLSLASDLAQHKVNLFSNEIHMTDDQADAALGSFGTPSLANPYVTSLDPRIPTQGENDAMAGSDGTPSGANRFVTEQFPISAPVQLSFPFPPGSSIGMPSADGPFFVGNGTVNSAAPYFFIMDPIENQGYVNTLNQVCSTIGMFKDALLSAPLNPGIDADADGYYTGDLYIQTNNLVDTGVRVVYGKRQTLSTANRDFTVVVTPGDAAVPASVVEKVLNIKGRPYNTLVPAAEQNITLRKDLDSLSSYVGSALETNVVAAEEDFDRLSVDPILGVYFIKNNGIPPSYTFQNTGLTSFTYNPILGKVTYGAAVNLSGLRIGDRFIDGVGIEYLVVAFSDLLNTVDIVSVETGEIPGSISTSVGTSVDGSVKVNNNPRNILLSEMKFNFQSEVILAEKIEQTGRYSKPDGNIEWGIRRADGRFDPRIAFYGGFQPSTVADGGGNFVVNRGNSGEILVTGFMNGLSLLMRRDSTSPSLSVSINGQAPTVVTTSDSGSISTSLGSTLEPKYYRVPVATGLSNTFATTVSIKRNASASPLALYGFELFRDISPSIALLEPGVAFESARIVSRNAIDNVPILAQDPGERGGRTRYALAENAFNVSILTLADLDKNSTPAGTVTGTALTITTGITKLVNYRVNDIIMLTNGLVAEMRRIVSMSSPNITLDNASSISGSCFLRHICSTVSTVSNVGEEEEIVRYSLPGDFINGTAYDLASTDAGDRFVLSRDGHTLLSGINLLNYSSSSLIGSNEALRVATGSVLKFRVMSTRLDVISVGSALCTANISIDGSPSYPYSFPASAGQRRTIFYNGRYQDHEVTITVTSGNLDLSQIILFGPEKPVFPANPNVVVDLVIPAGYLPSLGVFISSPNVYPFGTVFYEDTHNTTKGNGSGVGSNWSSSYDWVKSPYGPYSNTSLEGSYAEFYFLGDSFELQYIKGPDHGMFKVEIDGVALESTGGTVVGDYSGLVVDGYSSVYGKQNIGCHSLTFGYHKVKAYIENSRQKNPSATDYKMAFVGYFVGNGSGYMAFGYNKEGVYSGTVDLRNFIPLPETAKKVSSLTPSEIVTRQSQILLTAGTTSMVVSIVPLPDNNYSVVANMLNSIDSSPNFQAITITNQTPSSFTASWNDPLDTGSYYLNYLVLKI